MASPSPAATRRTVLAGVVIPGITYLLVTAVAALATPAIGDRNPAFAIWLGGGLILFLILARSFGRSFPTSIRVGRRAAALVSALGVSVVAAFIGFVLMVNIWERLGLGH